MNGCGHQGSSSPRELGTIAGRLAAVRAELVAAEKRCKESGDARMMEAMVTLRIGVCRGLAVGSVSRLVFRLGMGRTTFYRRFKAATGMTPHAYRLARGLLACIDSAQESGRRPSQAFDPCSFHSYRTLKRECRLLLDAKPSQVMLGLVERALGLQRRP